MLTTLKTEPSRRLRNGPALAAIVPLYGVEISFAWAVTIIGVVMPRLIEEFKIGETAAGLIGTMQNLVALLTTMIVGATADRVGTGRLLLLGSFFLILPALVMGTALSYLVLLIGMGLIGLAIGIVDPMINAETAKAAGNKQGLFINLLHTLYGVGATLTPLAAVAVMSCGTNWRGPVFVGAGIALAAAVWLWRTRGKGETPLPIDRTAPQSSNVRLRRDGRLWLLGMGMFFYAGSQRGLSVWVVYFMERTIGAGETAAAAVFSLLFLMVLAGRILSIMTERWLPRTRFLLLYGVGGAAGLFFLPAAADLKTAQTALVVYGLFTAAIFPIATALGVELHPRRTGAVTGIIYGSATAGGIVAPLLTGAVAEEFGLRLGMAVCSRGMALAALCFILLAVVLRGEKRPGNAAA